MVMAVIGCGHKWSSLGNRCDKIECSAGGWSDIRPEFSADSSVVWQCGWLRFDGQGRYGRSSVGDWVIDFRHSARNIHANRCDVDNAVSASCRNTASCSGLCGESQCVAERLTLSGIPDTYH